MVKFCALLWTSCSKTQMLSLNKKIFQEYWLCCSRFITFMTPFTCDVCGLLSVIHKQYVKNITTVDQSEFLTRFRTDFTSPVWNSCCWGTDIPPSKMSLAARRKGCIHRLQKFQFNIKWFVLFYSSCYGSCYSIQKIWAVIAGNAIFLLFLVCSADLDNSGLFSYHLKYYSFLFMHQISSWVVCVKQNSKHSRYFLYITKQTVRANVSLED